MNPYFRWRRVDSVCWRRVSAEERFVMEEVRSRRRRAVEVSIESRSVSVRCRCFCWVGVGEGEVGVVGVGVDARRDFFVVADLGFAMDR